MHRRFLGFVRDAWWLFIIVGVAAVVLGLLIRPALGIAVIVCCFVVFTYFAFMRYDNDGQEVSDTLD